MEFEYDSPRYPCSTSYGLSTLVTVPDSNRFSLHGVLEIDDVLYLESYHSLMFFFYLATEVTRVFSML